MSILEEKCPYCNNELLNGIIGPFKILNFSGGPRIYIYKKNNQKSLNFNERKKTINVSSDSNYKSIKYCEKCSIFIGTSHLG